MATATRPAVAINLFSDGSVTSEVISGKSVDEITRIVIALNRLKTEIRNRQV
jgi:hypothetical protein